MLLLSEASIRTSNPFFSKFPGFKSTNCLR